MKKLGLLICGILIFILGLFIYINYIDNSYLNNVKSKIMTNTEIKNIEYINVYNNYYIVIDNKIIYLLDDKYSIVSNIEKKLVHQNNNNYDIIYNDNRFMYLNDVYDEDMVIYEYYDIYTYELIKKVIVGGKDGSDS